MSDEEQVVSPEQQVTMKKGPFDLVERVNGNVAGFENAGRTFLGRARARAAELVTGRGGVSSDVDFSSFARNVVRKGKIGDSDVQSLQDGVLYPYGGVKKFSAGVAFCSVLSEESRRHYQAKNDGGESEERQGKLVADLITVLPPRVAAAMIVGVADSDFVKSVEAGEYKHPGLSGIAYDPRQCAIAGMALVDRVTRVNVFGEMAQLSPGRGSDASNFHLLMMNQWHNRHSENSGQTHIDRHLPEDQREAQKQQVLEDLTATGPGSIKEAFDNANDFSK